MFFPGKYYGQRSLAGYSPWDGKRVRHDLAINTHTHTHTHTHTSLKPETSLSEGYFKEVFQSKYNLLCTRMIITLLIKFSLENVKIWKYSVAIKMKI